VGSVSAVFAYRGREVSAQNIEFIRGLIAAHPGLSRRRLSAKLCQAWNWVQPNGQLRDMVARSLMLELHRAGHIQLPAQRCCPVNNVARHRAPEPDLALAWAPLECSLAALGSLGIRQVRRSPAEPLFNRLMQTHHYLGYTQPVGEHLKYLVYAQGQPISALAFCSSPRHLGPRDRFIGWSASQRRAGIHLLAYNTRYLLMPWVKVPQLASHLLGRVARQIAADWQALYGHPVYLLETFIDPERFRGTCYRAANYIYLGLTTGRGKDDQTRRPNRSLKQLWVYPLRRDFRRCLTLAAHG
jgi:hypothetical protein